MDKVKQTVVDKLRSRYAQAGFVVMATALSASAHAELPAEVQAAFTGIQNNFDSMATIAWPIVGSIVGGFILIKLFKKFANRAT